MANGWTIDPVADTITFLEPPPAGASNIVIREFLTSSINATDVWAFGAWSDAYGYPGEVEFYSDRLIFAATRAQPQTLWMSRTADYSMFGKSTPMLDDDPITASFNARQLNVITDLVPLESLVALTTGGEWRATGGEGNVLTPSTVGFRPQTKVGASDLPALIVDESAIFAQAKGYSVRGLSYTFEKDGYSDTDLTAFSAHLVENRVLTDWAYQAVPYSAVYACRDDGLLLTMTYKREHRVVAWARQPTDGKVLSVASIPETKANAIYMAVRRVVNGSVKVFIERQGPQVDDVREWVGADCALVYDGRNRTDAALLISGTDLTAGATVAMTMTAPRFMPEHVGSHIVLDYDGTPTRIEITEVTSTTTAVGRPERDIANPDVGTAWALAARRVTGLGHLHGAEVRIGADGMDYPRQVVADGGVTLDPPGVRVCVGLPYLCDYESLDFTLVGQAPVAGKTKLCRTIDILIKGTKSLQAGTTFAALEQLATRSTESLYLPAMDKTETVRMSVSGEWQKSPRVCIRHDSAYPACVLSTTPHVDTSPTS